MILIQEVLVSQELLEERFMCELGSCKGACCWLGDYGAPLEPEEMDVLEKILPQVSGFLAEESREKIKEDGPYSYYKGSGKYGTSLMPDGACVFMTRDEKGIAGCGIEQAFFAGETDFRKPISCHLYPVRVTKNPHMDFEALNYERWDICKAACSFGEQHKMPLYRFVKDALIRKYGEAFYLELDEVASQWPGRE